MTTTAEVSPEQFKAAEAEADEILNMLMARIAPVGTSKKYLKVLVYGNPGVRKTSFAGGAPEPLVVDVERGTLSLRNFAETRNVHVLEFKSIKQVELLIEKMSHPGTPLDKYETLVIDSFSEMQKRDLDDIVRTAASADASRNKFLPTGPDYNINTEHMRQIASALRDLDKHIIVTCHVKEEKDEASGRLLVRPNLTPKLAGTMAGIFDIVGYMNLDNRGNETTWSLQVHPTNNVTAKTRIGGLPPVITDPKFSDLLDAFTKEN